MKKRRLPALILSLVLLCACAQTAPESESAQPDQTQAVVQTTVSQDLIGDDESLYEAYDPTDVVCFYVTVLGGNAADGTDHSLEEVNSYLNLQGMEGVEKILTEVILQVGDETGPLAGELGYTSLASNATMNVRGRTSTGYSQKSYRFTLFDDAGLWRGQRAIALNKHPADVTRLRNMLYFRLLQDVPSIPSLRTQFVHLYVKDLTAEDPADAFEDYGLYTQVELPNNRYLRNHGFSINGNLYKAQMCEMYRYEDKLKLATDPDYDPEAFATVLEPKTSEDHTKLLEMLDAVNDDSIPIQQVLDTYFDLDNLTSYLAFNLLMGNPDSNAQNYLLYSPLNSSTWYYLCWDGDDCLNYSENEIRDSEWEIGEWTRGVSNYWGVVLFNRLLRLPSFREALTEKVELLYREVVTPQRVEELIGTYRAVVDEYTAVLPDSEHMQITQAQRDAILAAMPGDVERSYQYYYESLEKPMPFFLGQAELENGTLRLNWGSSYDLDGEILRYDVQLARDWSFEEVLWEQQGLLTTGVELPAPEAGEYYWRATVTNESGYTQTAFDSVITASGSHNGMRRFTIGADGTVVNPE